MSAKFESDGKAELELRSPLRSELKVPSDDEVAACRPCRIASVVIFSLILVAMLVAAIVVIATSKKCGSPIKQEEYWRKNTFYQIYVPSFKDTSGDGIGDLEGIIQKLSYLEEIGVKMILLSGLIKESDFRTTRTLEDRNVFEKLVAKARDRDIGVSIAFDPTYNTNDSVSFGFSRKDKFNKYRSWYHWRTVENNWLNKKNGKSWNFDRMTNESYYFYADEAKPFLNYNNSEVMDMLKDALTFWLGKGAKGFQLMNFQRFIVSSSYKDNPAGKSIYDKDLYASHQLLRKLNAHVASKNGFLMGALEKVEDGPHIKSYFGMNEKERQLNLVMNNYFTEVPKGGQLGENTNKTVVEYQRSVPHFAWPSWIFGTTESSRLASRYGLPELSSLFIVLQLSLPGCPIFYYGDEIGLKDRSLEVMAWNGKSNGGFSTVKPWYNAPVVSSTNVEEQKKRNGSYAIFKSVNLLRLREPSLYGAKINVLYAKGQVVILHRFETGSKGFIVALNLGVAPVNANYNANGFKKAVVEVDTLFKFNNREFRVGAINLGRLQGLILRVLE